MGHSLEYLKTLVLRHATRRNRKMYRMWPLHPCNAGYIGA